MIPLKNEGLLLLKSLHSIYKLLKILENAYSYCKILIFQLQVSQLAAIFSLLL